MKTRNAIVLAVSFLFLFFAIGLPYWQVPYAQVALPDTLYDYELAAVFLLAGLLRMLGSKRPHFLLTVAFTGIAAPAAVMVRVVRDTSVDPTSHNLWPFEVAIAVAVGFSVAMVGALLGSLVSWGINRATSNRGGI